MLMGIVSWLVCGIVVGFIASKVVDLHGDDPRIGFAIGAAGGVVGGLSYSLISGTTISGLNVWGMGCAALVAIAPLVVWHIIRARAPHEAQTTRRSY